MFLGSSCSSPLRSWPRGLPLLQCCTAWPPCLSFLCLRWGSTFQQQASWFWAWLPQTSWIFPFSQGAAAQACCLSSSSCGQFQTAVPFQVPSELLAVSQAPFASSAAALLSWVIPPAARTCPSVSLSGSSCLPLPDSLALHSDSSSLPRTLLVSSART